MRYLSLDPRRITETVERLERRIGERFPDSGLRRVAGELVSVARDAVARIERAQRPYWPLRLAVMVLVLGFLGGAVYLIANLRMRQEELSISDLIQDADSLLASTVFIGASVVFLVSLETRIKRRRVLNAVHELRSIAHIVDMHQLTKDPESLLTGEQRTPSSPVRAMSAFELTRYLDYSSELFSLISKVAALYLQGFQDPVVLDAVDDVEGLTSGLSRKVWQKIMILDRIARPAAR